MLTNAIFQTRGGQHLSSEQLLAGKSSSAVLWTQPSLLLQVLLRHTCFPQAPEWYQGGPGEDQQPSGWGLNADYSKHSFTISCSWQSQIKSRVAISIFTLQQILPQKICELQYASLEAKIHPVPHLASSG